MKFIMSSDVKTTREIVNVASKINKIYDNEKHSTSDNSAKLFGTKKTYAGPAFNVNYDAGVEDDHLVHIDIDIDDEAIIMALPMLIKIAKAIKPVIDAGKALISLADVVSDNIKTAMKEFNNSFNKAFGKKALYATLTVYSADISLADAVVVKDDGFNKPRVIYAAHGWDCHNIEITKMVYDKKYTNMAIFEDISEEEAIKEARELLPAIRADVRSMTRQAQKKNEE